jgi:hypothetical protein
MLTAMKKKIKYIALFILGVLIAEIPFFHLIGYVMLSMVQSIHMYILDAIIFVLGFIIGFKALNDLGKLKHKKIVL